jgi:ABC-type oligopeptide transport system substrate-binding subunit
MSYLFFRLNGPAWERDANIRRALELAIDRHVIADSVTHGLNDPADTLVPANLKNYVSPGPAPGPSDQAAREKEARRLWALPGAVRPRKLKLSFPNGENIGLILKSVAEMWKHVLDVEATLDESASLETDAQAYKYPFDLLYDSWNGMDVGDFLEPFLSNAGDSNYVRYAAKAFDNLIMKSRATTDPLESGRYLQEAEKMILAEGVVIPLLQSRRYFLLSAKVRGFSVNVMGRFSCRDLSLAP